MDELDMQYAWQKRTNSYESLVEKRKGDQLDT